MDDWYNDSLLRYPRVLIQKEQDTPLSSRVGSNVIRIRVRGRRSESEELEPPHVTVHKYDSSTNSPTGDSVKSAEVTPVPVQVRRMASPVTNIAFAQRHPGPKASIKEPVKALPLTSLLQDFNSNHFDASWSRLGHRQAGKEFPGSSHAANSFAHSFEKEFDKFTSEYSNRARTPFSGQLSQNPNSNSYTFRRHASEDVGKMGRRSVNSPEKRTVRAQSPNMFVSTYSQAAGMHRSRGGSPAPQGSKSSMPSAGQRDEASIAKAREVLDRVLKNLDNVKGRRNSIVNQAKDSIKEFSDGLDGKGPCRDDCDSGYSGSGDTTNVGFTWSSVEIKENVRKYNSSHHDSQFTEVADSEETFQGDIQICICLEKAVNMLLSTRPTSLFRSLGKHGADEERITASATIPSNTITRLHITSNDTTEAVVEQLLNKFSIVESPKSYGLYEQTLKHEKEVKLRKAASSEKPLLNYLRWNTESQEEKRFILKESHDSDILWESFSIPELSNFLMMLEMEHEEQAKTVRNKYLSYRHSMESRLQELSSCSVES